MLALETYDPTTGAGRGFVRLRLDGAFWRTVASCDAASHFFGPTAAALVRDRVTGACHHPIRVVRCLCPAPAGPAVVAGATLTGGAAT